MNLCLDCTFAAGAKEEKTPGDVIKACDITFAILADPAIAETVAFAPGNIAVVARGHVACDGGFVLYTHHHHHLSATRGSFKKQKEQEEKTNKWRGASDHTFITNMHTYIHKLQMGWCKPSLLASAT